jgi:hypothetical protein
MVILLLDEREDFVLSVAYFRFCFEHLVASFFWFLLHRFPFDSEHDLVVLALDDFQADKESVDSALEQHDGDMDTDCGHDVLVDAPRVTLEI